MMKMIVMNAPQSDQIGQLDEEKGVEKKIFTKSSTITIPFSKFRFEKNVKSYVTTMKTTIFGENFLKVFKIRSNDENIIFDVFSIPKIIFLEVSTKSFWKRPTGSRKEIIFLRNSKSGIMF